MKTEKLKEKIELTKDGLTTRIHTCLDEYIGFAIDSDLSGVIIDTIVEEVISFHLGELVTQVSMIDHPLPEELDKVIDSINQIKALYEQTARNRYSLV